MDNCFHYGNKKNSFSMQETISEMLGIRNGRFCLAIEGRWSDIDHNILKSAGGWL